jgi:hypothetical protein
MVIHEFSTNRFTSTQTQAETVSRWQERYQQLAKVLGSLGTEVMIERILETDRDIAPYHFIRHATHEFVVPPQEVTVSVDHSGVIDTSPAYGLVRESRKSKYDETKITGHVRVNYDDAESRIQFSVDNLMDNSELPEAVSNAIDSAFPREDSDSVTPAT